MDNDLNELHSLANTTFQNVSNLTPALRQMVANAKIYQKSVQSTCNLAVVFVESLQSVANAALMSEGATKMLGDVLVDIIDAYKEIENMKLELTKVFINEVIIPLESRAEIEINNMKVTHKSYNQENKIQTELVEKARAGVAKVKKKSIRRKSKSPKLQEKEEVNVQTMKVEETRLKKVREEGLRKALIEERRVYCFVAERMCAYGRGMVIYNNRISNFVSQKIPDWQQFIAKPTELPPDSEDIISNPTGYKMGTVKRKISRTEKKESIKRGKSFNSHFPTKYSTFDGRSSRGGSRPSLSAVTVSSVSNLSDENHTPRSKPHSPMFNGGPSPPFPTPPMSVAGGDNHSPTDGSICGVSPSPEPNQIELYIPPKEDDALVAASSPTKSEYANLVLLNKQEDPALAGRSHSFTVPKTDTVEQRKISLNRTESAVCDSMKRKDRIKEIKEGVEGTDFAARLALISNQLKFNQQQPDPSSKSRLKALYDHVAQDASQLSFEKEDIIIPICEPTSGWQYGENEKTEKSGWFPSAYTEEVLISSTGETQVKSPTTHLPGTSTHRNHKIPPPVARKMARGAGRKISVACGPLTTPSKKFNNVSENGRRSSLGDVPHLTTSSSMPQMIHMLAEGVEEKGHHRKHSNSLVGLELNHDDSFDDSTEDITTEKYSKKKKRSMNHDYDAMPPPPPPPPPMDEDEDDIHVLTVKIPPVDSNDNPFNSITFKPQGVQS